MRRVVLVGAESTGKTTLAQALANRFGTSWVPEFGREYWERKIAGFRVTDALPPWNSDEFVSIASEQQRRENLAARSANRVLICDTNAFATGLWHERYMRHRDARVDAIGARDAVHLYLLLEPDFPFVQDGFRDGESVRDWMHHRFLEETARSRVETIRLHGPIEERMAVSSSAIESLMQRRFEL